MKLKTITYGRTMNLGNYENFRLEMSIELEEGDDSNTAFETLTKSVDSKCEAIKTKKQNQK